ncbi:unnamed protein product [Ixodes hexagonus]
MGGSPSRRPSSCDNLSRKHTRRRIRDFSVRTFRTHTCQANLGCAPVAQSADAAGNSSRQRCCRTAVEAYFVGTFSSSPDVTAQEQIVDTLLSCMACVGELCTLTSAKSDALFKLLLSTIRVRLRTTSTMPTPYVVTFERVLERSRRTCLPSVYGGTCGLVDFPCVSLGLCDCVLRPVYCAIFYGNLDLLKLLLRYGAEVWSKDVCVCGSGQATHPLVPVYDTLNATAWARALKSKGDPLDLVRCHQLAALIVPPDVIELREACFAFLRLISPVAEYDKVVRMKRSLQHMCRLTLRPVLSKYRQLPHGVGLLTLPLSLQRYLLYQDFEDSL